LESVCSEPALKESLMEAVNPPFPSRQSETLLIHWNKFGQGVISNEEVDCRSIIHSNAVCIGIAVVCMQETLLPELLSNRL
jgi:hypothetical protein